LKSAGISQDFGDITSIYCPDPAAFGQFVEVGTFRGAEGRATTTLTGRYAADLASDLLKLAKTRCSADVQVNFGACDPPALFNTFTKKIILENAALTNFSTEDLGALEPGESGKINESSALSASNFYEVLPLYFTEKAKDVVTNEVMDVVFCDSVACGECGAISGGCQKIYAVSLTAGGSPLTPADIVFSIDGGVTWYAHDIMSAGVTNPSCVCCLGNYVVVGTTVTATLDYALKSEIIPTSYETWTAVTTGFVTGKFPNDVWSVGTAAFFAGEDGYVYKCVDPTQGVTVLEAGVQTTEDCNCIHALDEYRVLCGCDAGYVLYTLDGVNWTAKKAIAAGSAVNTVWMKSEYEWFAGTASGLLYYTVDKGVTWTAIGFPGSGSGVVKNICFATDSVAYLSHTTAAPRGRILRSYDGGHSWNVLPESTGTMPLSDRFNALAACTYNPNLVVGVGLGDNAVDGIIVVGQG
jgi:hypothetical protein